MLRWASYPFVRITLSFIAGILLYFAMGKEFSYSTELFAFLLAAFLVVFILANRLKTSFATSLVGISGLLCFIAAGIWFTDANTETHQPLHLSKFSTKPDYYIGVVDDYVVQKSGYQSTVLEVQKVQLNGKWQSAIGKVQLSVPDNSVQTYLLNYGDVLLIKGAPQPVAAPGNPNQFSYKDYLANKNIYHRQYLQTQQYQKIASAPPNQVLYFSIQFRRKLDKLLREQITEKREYGISSALILGVKDDLDNAIRTAYANTGTMHVLAVSGLHVGLIYSLLLLFFSRFRRNKWQRLLSALVILAVLGLYAFITGLSPSVLRAVVMFSLITIAQAISRKSNIYNTVAIAAFVLLWYNPYNLLEVGFQLSFLAVLGIVYLQPRFYTLLTFDNKLLDKIWALFTVAVAAQLATLPLGLFYFHQFPVYFWLANIVVVPAAILVLYSGVAALALSWIPYLSSLLFKLHFWLTWGMNWFNLQVQDLPNALINGIDISFMQTLLFYAFILLLLLFFARKQLRYFRLAAGVVAILALQQVIEVLQQKHQEQMVFYNVRGATAISFIKGQQATVLADSSLFLNPDSYTFNVQPHLWQLGIQEPDLTSFSSYPKSINYRLLPDGNEVYVWQGQRILILSEPLQLQPKENLQVDYIIIKNNVRLKPTELKQYTFKYLVLDGSSTPWYREKLYLQFRELNLAYYDVAEQGAFVLNL